MSTCTTKPCGKSSVSAFSSRQHVASDRPFPKSHPKSRSAMGRPRSPSVLLSTTSEAMLPADRTTPAASGLATSASPGALDWTARPAAERPWPPSWGPPRRRRSEIMLATSSSGTIVALVVSAALLIVATLGLYSCAASASRTRRGADEPRGGRGSCSCSCSCHRRHPERDSDLDLDLGIDLGSSDEDTRLRDVEAHAPTPEAEAFVGTARQGRVYGPGSASMIDIRGRRGTRRCGPGSGPGSGSARSSPSARDTSSPSGLDLEPGVERTSREQLSLREALSDEGMMELTGGRMSSDHLSLREALSEGSLGMAQGGGMTSRNRLRPRERPLASEDLKALPAPKGKRQRNVLRKRVKSGSKQLLSDMWRVYAA